MLGFKVNQLRAELSGARLAPDGCCEGEAEASDSSSQEPEAVEKAEAAKQKLRFDRKTRQIAKMNDI